jgi:hypothetical protein
MLPNVDCPDAAQAMPTDNTTAKIALHISPSTRSLTLSVSDQRMANSSCGALWKSHLLRKDFIRPLEMPR